MYKKLLVVLCLSFMVVAAGCSAKEKKDSNPAQEPQANTIMSDFNAFIQKDSSIEEVANFMKANISNVSREDATKMVDQLEKMQKKSLPQFEEIINKESLQEKFHHEYPAIVANKDIQDAEIKELVAKTENNGYKIETAEGMYFPIIDYGFYKGFRSYVTADVKDYIDIMTRESEKVPAKDAALIISWDEVLNRALSQEKFLNTHKDSIRINEIKQLYKNYVTFTFYGANNTPLFSYDSQTLDPEAKNVYIKAVAGAKNSELLKELNDFLKLVEDHQGKLTTEVEKYRAKIIEGLD